MLPILYQSPDLVLYSYPLMMGLGWGAAYQIFFALEPREVPAKHLQLLYWGIFLFAWVGAKVFFYLTLPTHVSEDLLGQMSFWTGGGFVFYGGLLGGVLFLLLYKGLGLKLTSAQLWPLVPALTFGHAIGRIGCFLAGCCYGSATDWWWGVHMHGQDRHPTQLLEAMGLFLLAGYSLRSKSSGRVVLGIYLCGYGCLRFAIEIFRGDEIRGQWGPLTPSQWISAMMVAAGVWVLYRRQKSKA